MYFVGINVGAQVTIILLTCRPCVVIVNLLGQVCTLGRAPCTKETLPDFHEWCRVTRHPRLFRRLTGCQRTPREWGVTISDDETDFIVGIVLRNLATTSNFVEFRESQNFMFFEESRGVRDTWHEVSGLRGATCHVQN